MESGFSTALLPLKRYARFHGRSTRFEAILFALLVAILFLAIGYSAPLIGPEALLWTQRGLLLLLACPILALAVRRLHDTGRSAWWLLVGLPLLGFELWEAYARAADPLAPSPIEGLPLAARTALALTGVALFILLAWDDEQADNRHGPNPRRRVSPAAA